MGWCSLCVFWEQDVALIGLFDIRSKKIPIITDLFKNSVKPFIYAFMALGLGSGLTFMTVLSPISLV